MKVSMLTVEEHVKSQCTQLLLGKKEQIAKIVAHMLNQHNIPTSRTMDMISMRTPLAEYNEFWIFCLVEALDFVFGTKKVLRYFTEPEIEIYSKEKIQDKKNFPIVIKCLPVTNDQWIGVIDSNFLLDLRDKQLLRYNENTQRVMKRKVQGNDVYYKIAVSPSAVQQIEESMLSSSYIPDDITLNIPLEPETDFYYDEKKSILVINCVNYLDIGDGYHRLLALFRAKQKNPDFVYPMELRIINFHETKAKQFIFQKDQKTKMNKLQSDSMNMNDAANIIVERLNENVMFNLMGQISRNQGNVDFAHMAKLVYTMYFKDIPKSSHKSMIPAVVKEIVEKLNHITEIKTEWLNHRFTLWEITIAMYAVKMYSVEELTRVTPYFDKILERIKQDDRKIPLTKTGLYQTTLEYIEKIFREEIGDV